MARPKIYREEDKLLEDTIDWLEKQRGIFAIRINDRQHKGYSDLFICVQGLFVVIELKDDIGTASLHQKVFIQKIIRAGGIGAICRTLEEVQEVVKGVLEYGQHYTTNRTLN